MLVPLIKIVSLAVLVQQRQFDILLMTGQIYAYKYALKTHMQILPLAGVWFFAVLDFLQIEQHGDAFRIVQ